MGDKVDWAKADITDFPNDYLLLLKKTFAKGEKGYTAILRFAVFTFLFFNRDKYLDRDEILTGVTKCYKDFKSSIGARVNKKTFAKLLTRLKERLEEARCGSIKQNEKKKLKLIIEKDFEKEILAILDEYPAPFAVNNLHRGFDQYLLNRNTEEVDRIKKVYVNPDNYDEALKILNENHILFIIGPPGIGKTAMSIRLAFEFESSFRNILRVGPTHVEDFLKNFNSDQQIIIFDDPFGKYDRNNNLSLYIEKLEAITKNNLLIVSSQSEYFYEAENKYLNRTNLCNYYVELMHENYLANIGVIFDNLLKYYCEECSENLRISKEYYNFALERKHKILKEINYPHNIQKFIMCFLKPKEIDLNGDDLELKFSESVDKANDTRKAVECWIKEINKEDLLFLISILAYSNDGAIVIYDFYKIMLNISGYKCIPEDLNDLISKFRGYIEIFKVHDDVIFITILDDQIYDSAVKYIIKNKQNGIRIFLQTFDWLFQNTESDDFTRFVIESMHCVENWSMITNGQIMFIIAQNTNLIIKSLQTKFSMKMRREKKVIDDELIKFDVFVNELNKTMLSDYSDMLGKITNIRSKDVIHLFLYYYCLPYLALGYDIFKIIEIIKEELLLPYINNKTTIDDSMEKMWNNFYEIINFCFNIYLKEDGFIYDLLFDHKYFRIKAEAHKKFMQQFSLNTMLRKWKKKGEKDDKKD